MLRMDYHGPFPKNVASNTSGLQYYWAASRQTSLEVDQSARSKTACYTMSAPSANARKNSSPLWQSASEPCSEYDAHHQPVLISTMQWINLWSSGHSFRRTIDFRMRLYNLKPNLRCCEQKITQFNKAPEIIFDPRPGGARQVSCSPPDELGCLVAVRCLLVTVRAIVRVWSVF
jgi:hypothetical protein